MRRWSPLLMLVGAVVAALVLAACGSSSSSSSNPLATELSYLPPRSVGVVVVATDPNSTAIKNVQALAHKFPILGFGESAIVARLQQAGINFDSDIRPLLGNPILIGLTSPTFSGPTSSTAVGVWITKDAGKLDALIKKPATGAHRIGTRDGATLYGTSGGGELAVDGATLVAGATAGVVNSALDLHAHGGGLTQAQYNRAVSGLPSNPLVQVFGNLTGALATPQTASARQVPWVAALRGYGVSISANSSGLSFDFRLDTTGSSLSSSQVPIATGTAPAGVVNSLPAAVGLMQPAHIASFVESAAQVANPASYAKFLRRDATLRRQTGVDLRILLSELTGELVIATDSHTTMARAGVSDPAAARRMITKLMTHIHEVAPTARSATPIGGGFYAVKQPKRTINVGMVGNNIVLGNAPPSSLRTFAETPASPVANQGSVAFRVALPTLLQVALKHPPSATVQQVLSALGDLTGWISATRSATTGNATLAIK